ncbi:MAG TPA: glycosyltransferase family 4 protein [Methylomirabilota bacterium]|nr:glycosyltransferase family 4 protein [Methylomirabilota bacterium]
MRILMLGPWVPSARHAVEAERLHSFARHLAARHRLTLAFATSEPNLSGPVSALRAEFEDLEFAMVPRRLQRLWSALRLIAGASVDLTYFNSAALRTRLRDRARTSPFDLIYAASAGMIQYALELEGPGPLVLDFGELDSEWWERRAEANPGLKAGLYRGEAARVRELEQAAARRATVSVVSSAQAAERVASFAPVAPVVVVPNGVDPERHPAGPHRAPEPVIAFTGSLDGAGGLEAAAEFCRLVLPAVRAEVTGARLAIPGRYLPRPARRLARLPGVQIADNGGDLRAILRHAAVAVSPAGDSNGARQAALEAMAAGVPLVAGRNSLNGLGAEADREVYVEDDPGAMARRLVELLTSELVRAEAGRRGRAFVRAHHSWEAAAGRFAEVVNGVLRIGPSSAPPEAAG